MGGWRILACYAFVTAVLLLIPFLRRRPLLISGGLFLSFHLLWLSTLLADAAIFPEGIPLLRGPLTLLGLLAASSFLFRDDWLVVGSGGERMMHRLEECCSRLGIPAVHDGGRLVLKRHGTAIQKLSLLPGIGLVRFDRRRREREVDRLREDWRRSVRNPAREGRR